MACCVLLALRPASCCRCLRPGLQAYKVCSLLSSWCGGHRLKSRLPCTTWGSQQNRGHFLRDRASPPWSLAVALVLGSKAARPEPWLRPASAKFLSPPSPPTLGLFADGSSPLARDSLLPPLVKLGWRSGHCNQPTYQTNTQTTGTCSKAERPPTAQLVAHARRGR